MVCVIYGMDKVIRVNITDKRSVPDVLKTCKALGFVPVRWYVKDV